MTTLPLRNYPVYGKSFLGISEINENDDFFDAGGRSLLGVELFSRLEKDFNVELKLSQLINNSQFSEILKLLEQNNATVQKSELEIPSLCECLVPIKINNPNKIVFCFHGVGGNVLNYRVLKDHLNDYSLIGVQSIGVDGNREIPETMDEIVERYIAEIKQVQSVILFDTFGPNLKVKIFNENSLGKRIKDSIIWRGRKYYSNTFLFFFRVFGIKIPHKLRYFDIEVQNYKVFHAYKVPTYNGRVDLIRAPKIEKTSYMDSHLGWSDLLLGEFNIYEIEGHHEYFVEAKDLPNVFENIISCLNI